MQRLGTAQGRSSRKRTLVHRALRAEGAPHVGEMVETEDTLLQSQTGKRPIGLGVYTIDSHYVQRFVDIDGRVFNGGTIGALPEPTGDSANSTSGRGVLPSQRLFLKLTIFLAPLYPTSSLANESDLDANLAQDGCCAPQPVREIASGIRARYSF